MGTWDFLIGERFAAETGSVLLADEVVETFDGQRVLLMHGDLLCTDDVDYQSFRRWSRRQLGAEHVSEAANRPRRPIVKGIRRTKTS